MCCCFSLTFTLAASKGAACDLEYLLVSLDSNSFFKQLIFTLLEQLNISLQGVSIPLQCCLQWHLQPVPLMHITCQKIPRNSQVYSWGKWLTVSLFLTTFTANLLTVNYQAPVLHKVFLLLPVPKQFNRCGISVQLNRKWIPPRLLFCALRLLPHLKLGYQVVVHFISVAKGFQLYGVLQSENLKKKDWIKRAF